jgi:hypothetical protein
MCEHVWTLERMMKHFWGIGCAAQIGRQHFLVSIASSHYYSQRIFELCSVLTNHVARNVVGPALAIFKRRMRRGRSRRIRVRLPGKRVSRPEHFALVTSADHIHPADWAVWSADLIEPGQVNQARFYVCTDPLRARTLLSD